MTTLTTKEKDMLSRLVKEEMISWLYTKPAETKCLNRLVKKGYAEDIMGTFWKPTQKATEHNTK